MQTCLKLIDRPITVQIKAVYNRAQGKARGISSTKRIRCQSERGVSECLLETCVKWFYYSQSQRKVVQSQHVMQSYSITCHACNGGWEGVKI